MTSAPDGAPALARHLDRRVALALLLSIVALGALTTWRLAPRPNDGLHEFRGQTMGTTFLVKIDADMSATDRDRAQEVIQGRLDHVNRLMSTFDSTSELSRFNRHRGVEAVPASDDLIHVLTTALDVSRRSDGAFDVTVAPLVNAWGFGPDGRPERPPLESELQALRERVGYERIAVDGGARTLSKTHPQTVVDLSAIAKGYGVERVTEGLAVLGHRSILVEVGGEVKAMGLRRSGDRWRIGIEAPEVGLRSVYATVELVDVAIATSGDYRSFYEQGGARYAHIIDPRTGLPIAYAGASVSVIHSDAATADAWATALSVLGPDAGYELAEREGIVAVFVMRSNGGHRALATPAFVQRYGALAEVGR